MPLHVVSVTSTQAALKFLKIADVCLEVLEGEGRAMLYFRTENKSRVREIISSVADIEEDDEMEASEMAYVVIDIEYLSLVEAALEEAV